jgi:hypothetical protein
MVSERVMKSVHLGARTHLLFAALLWLLAGPAGAEDVPYLMYVRGSEGPPATPMRVLWDVIDSANARITIDFGEKYEPALAKLGFGRVLKYDAKPDKKAPFAVRDLEFTRLVKSISTSVVQALLTASSAPGAWAQPPDAKVEDAALLITPRNPRLEIAALLHVSYLAPQKSGPPKVQDLIKGDMVFVGQQEAASPEAAGRSNKP